MSKFSSNLLITEHQKFLLKTLSSRHSTEERLVKRAKILLFSKEGMGRRPLADKLGISSATVDLWRNRWREKSDEITLFEGELNSEENSLKSIKKKNKALMARIVDTLSDAPRPGTPSKFTQDQFEQIVALACKDPEDEGIPMEHWTHEVLAREAAARHIVDSISTTRVWEILNKKTSAP